MTPQSGVTELSYWVIISYTAKLRYFNNHFITIKVDILGMAWLNKLIKKQNEDLSMEEGEESGEEGQLTVDVFQDKDNIYIKSTIAGVKPEDLDITLGSDSITIHGERRRDETIADEDYFYQECYWGAFSRTLPLPVEVDVDKAAAELKDGILTLTLPKASRSRTKKVKIRSEM